MPDRALIFTVKAGKLFVTGWFSFKTSKLCEYTHTFYGNRPGCIVWLVWYVTTKRAGSSSIPVLVGFYLKKSKGSSHWKVGPEVHFSKWVQKYTSTEVGREVHFQKCTSESDFQKCISEVYFVLKCTNLPKPKCTNLPKTSEVGPEWVYVGCCCKAKENQGKRVK